MKNAISTTLIAFCLASTAHAANYLESKSELSYRIATVAAANSISINIESPIISSYVKPASPDTFSLVDYDFVDSLQEKSYSFSFTMDSSHFARLDSLNRGQGRTTYAGIIFNGPVISIKNLANDSTAFWSQVSKKAPKASVNHWLWSQIDYVIDFKNPALQDIFGTRSNYYWSNVSSKILIPANEEVSIRLSGSLYSRFGVRVPEPSTWSMLILGFGLIGSRIRKGRSARYGSAAQHV